VKAKKTFNSNAQAAEGLGIDLKTVKIARSLGCPAWTQGVRINAKKLQEWLADPKHAAQVQEAIAAQGVDQAIKRERLRKLTIENDQAAGLMLSKEEMARKLAALCAEANAILGQALEVEVVALAGMSAVDLRAHGEKIRDKICGRFREFAQKWA
jgi:hypothetical protein